MAGTHFDCAIIGAGIVGFAHALAASRAGLRVVEREARAIGASIRNFGFVTVTGQEQGDCWRRVRGARDIWAEVAPRAGIPVHHRGLVFAARRPEGLAVPEEFVAGPMGGGCRMLAARRPRHSARCAATWPAPCTARMSCASKAAMPSRG